MVATDASLATQVGVNVLEQGGNAVDAAVAVAFALAVVYPEAGNIGGGGFMVLRTADGQVAALDFRETAPGGASRDMFLDAKGELTGKSLTGALAAGVPGSVAGLWAAHEKYGSKPWKELVAPAIKLATEGFAVDARFAGATADEVERLGKFPASAALFLPGGKPLVVGSTWKNPELAATLQRIADDGPKGFYDGQTADLLVAEAKRGGGIITKADLAGYQAKWRTPLEFDYRKHHVISMPPPSSGGLVLALILQTLEGYDLRAMGWHSVQALHVEAEAMRRAFALRNATLGDPDFVKVPMALFVGPDAASRQRSTIALDKATPSSEIAVPSGGPPEGPHTTHFSVVDDKGAAVAVTTTINLGFGAAETVTGAGFLLNNEMDDFATSPGKPNAFGLVQGESNAVAPGKRMLSSMSPTIVVGPDGKVRLVTGAAGGPTIITATFAIISNVVDYDLGVVAAVGAPRIHHQHLPDQITYEELGLDKAALDGLAAKGHRLATKSHIADAPSILRVGDRWTGGAEPRNPGSTALGY